MREFFASRELPFFAELLRAVSDQAVCHVYFEPSLRGFRASRESDLVRSIFGVIDPYSFISRRRATGESHDILKTVLSQLSRPYDVQLYVSEAFSSEDWGAAQLYHFPSAMHSISVKPVPTAKVHAWATDHLKSGRAGGQTRILVPRRLFEGRREDGVGFKEALGAYSGEEFVRSKLSWEGGDLLLARRPGALAEDVLFYGAAVRSYWGQSLTDAEFGYVLALEFGADRAIALHPNRQHADYVLAFAPGTNIALVSELRSGDRTVVVAAAEELLRLYGSRAPQELTALAELLSDESFTLVAGDRALVAKLDSLAEQLAAVQPDYGPVLEADFEKYVGANCPDQPEECFSGAGKARMLRQDPDLLRRAAEAEIDLHLWSVLPRRLLGLIEGQLAPNADAAAALEQTAARVAELGFRVIRVPYLAVPVQKVHWTGISYVNLLAIDGKLFVPALGLGDVEDEIFEQLQEELEGSYRVIPVFARASLLDNGGVHCVVATVRSPLQTPARPSLRVLPPAGSAGPVP